MDFSFAHNSSSPGLVASNLPAVMSSEVWSDDEGAVQLMQIAEDRLPVRVQISAGAEFQKYENSLRAFLELGGGCDILVDRPLPKDFQQKLLLLTNEFDCRLCFVVSRYFDVHAVVQSLLPEIKEHLFLLFLPPESKNSCYLSNDEVVRVLNKLDPSQEWNALILSNIAERCANVQDREFFSSLDTESYYSSSHLSNGYSLFRNTVSWMARRKFVFLLDLIYSFIVFIKNPQNFVRYRTWASLKQLPGFLRHQVWASLRHGIHMGTVILWHRILKPLPQLIRYKVFVAGYGFLRYRAWASLRHGIHMGFVFLWYRVLQPLNLFCRYTIYPRLHVFIRYRVPWILGIIFYPVLKIYWFISYQLENRLLPLLKRESKDP